MNIRGNVLINSLLILSLTSIVMINISNETVQAAKIQDVVFSRDISGELVEESVFKLADVLKSTFYDNSYHLSKEWEIKRNSSQVKHLLVYMAYKDIDDFEINGRELEDIKDEKLKKFFLSELESLYELIYDNGVTCDVSNATKSSGKAYPPDFDKNTGLPVLDGNGDVIYKTKKKNFNRLSYNVTCTTIDAEGVEQPLDYEFNHVYTAWKIELKKVEYLRYHGDHTHNEEDDFYPITFEIYVNSN